MGQVMVYQPKFYYLVCPVEYDPKKTFADVPDRIKDKVKEVLVDLDCPELAE